MSLIHQARPDAVPPTARNLPPVPFIVGVERSGTTLLRLMLDAHPDLAIPPETHFLPEVIQACRPAARPADAFTEGVTNHARWADFHLDPGELRLRVAALTPFDPGEALRAFYRLYAERSGKPRFGDKTPFYLLHMAPIQEVLPEARFIHLIRDGRDVRLSLKETWWGPRTAPEVARWWASQIVAARNQAAVLPWYVEVRYEDLLADPEAALRKICEFIDLPWDPAVLNYYERAGDRLAELNDWRRPDGTVISREQRHKIHERTRSAPDASRGGRWKREMPQAEVNQFEAVAGELLGELGYERVAPGPPDQRAEPAPGRRLLFASYHCFVDPSSGAAQSARDLLPLLAARGWASWVLCGPHLDFEDGRPLRQVLDSPPFRLGFGPPLTEHPVTGAAVPCALIDFAPGGIPVTIFEAPQTRSFQPPAPPEGHIFLAFFEKALDEFRPDLLLTYGGHWLAQAMIAAARRRGIPVVFWLHNCFYHSADFFRPLAGVIVPSRFAQEHYRRKLGLEFTALPPPLDWPSRVCPEVEGKYVTFVNPQPDKGVFVFAAIVQELHRRRPDIRFLVVEGRGKLTWLAEAGLDLDRIRTVFGMAATSDPRTFYAVSRAVLMPSLWDETFGRVASEALANGIPVLASRRGGLPEALGEAGFLFDIPPAYTPETRAVPTPEEVAPWVETIIRLWDDPEFYEEQRRRCRAAAEVWKPDRLAARYDEFLTAALRAGVQAAQEPVAPSEGTGVPPPSPSPPPPGREEADSPLLPGEPDTAGGPPAVSAEADRGEGPAISVIMPIYNGTAFLERALRSVQAQTFAGWELLAVDDGSADGSYDLLCRHAARDPRIRPFRLPENRGPSAARNHALRHARGETVTYLDCDDEYYPDYLAEAHARRREADVLLFAYDLVDERPPSPGKTWTYRPGPVRERLFRKEENIVVGLGVAHRRTLLDRTGLFNEDLHFEEDWELWRRFVDAGASFAFPESRSGRYHVRPDSQARTRRPPGLIPPADAGGPVFVLGGGGRTGSTLVQRLLLSSRRVLVWGEHRGVLVQNLRRIVEGMRGWLAWEARGQREQFLQQGYNTWIPAVNPELTAFQDSCREFLDRVLGAPARQGGYPRWGFKEIRYGRDDALFLQELFPDACFLISVRDPAACLQSIKGTGWYGPDFGADPARFLQEWARLTDELLAVQPQLRRAVLLRYEDLVTDPERAINEIARAAGVPADLFDRGVFGHHVTGRDLAPRPLDEADRQALADPAVQAVASRLGHAASADTPAAPAPRIAGPPANRDGPRRLLFSSFHCFLDPSSGAAQSARDLLPLLAGRGWQCRVFSGSQLDFEDGRPFRQLLDEPEFGAALGRGDPRPFPGLPVPCSLFDFAHAGIPVAVFDTPGTRSYQEPTPAEGAAFVTLFEQALNQFQPDVLITYGSYAAGRECISLARRRGIRVVFWLRNCGYGDLGPFRGVDAVLVPSQFSRDFYRRTLGLDCTPIPSPIDWDRVRCPGVEGKYVTLVNAQPTKGVFVFARIAAEVSRRRRDIPFLVVEGRGRMDWLKRAGMDLERLANVYAMKHTADPRKFYQVSRVVLMPSLWNETFGRVAAEAMLNGIPVLGSSRGSLPEVLAGAGFVFDIPPWYTPETRVVPTAAEVAPFVDTLLHLWDDPAFYEQTRRRCLAAAEAWRPDRLADRYDEFLTALLHRTPGPLPTG